MEYLSELDPSSPELSDWIVYKSDLKIAWQMIKAEVVSITDADELITYLSASAWRLNIPRPPDDGPIVS